MWPYSSSSFDLRQSMRNANLKGCMLEIQNFLMLFNRSSGKGNYVCKYVSIQPSTQTIRHYLKDYSKLVFKKFVIIMFNNKYYRCQSAGKRDMTKLFLIRNS